MAKKNLSAAKAAKNDEFYTQLADIETELLHYRKHFKDAVVYCNCDDDTWSNFWQYFHLCFESLGLKKLIATHYDEHQPTCKVEYEAATIMTAKSVLALRYAATVISAVLSASRFSRKQISS